MLEMAKECPAWNFVIQSPNDMSDRANLEHHRYLDMAELNVSGIDVVVGHCGAGTAFWALERGLRFIAVVDLTRLDKHQQDLGAWLEQAGMAIVLVNRGPAIEDIQRAKSTVFRPYQPDPFRFERIVERLNACVSING